MKKTELLQKLSTKFYKVFEPALQQTYQNLNYYLVKIYDRIGDGLRDSNIAFYVENEGQAEEVAYWSPSEPKPVAVSGFQQEINAYIAKKITNGVIEAAFSEQLDIVNETATYKVIMPDLTEKRIFVDRDSNGVLRHRVMV